MSAVPIFVCDVCRKEVRYTRWEDAPSGVWWPNHNPSTNKPDYVEVCLPCRRAFQKSFTSAYEERTAK